MGIVLMSEFYLRVTNLEEQELFLEICQRMNAVEKQLEVKRLQGNLFHVRGTEMDAGAAAILYRMFHRRLVNFQVA